MSHSTPDYTRFDDYLSKIESMERAKRRRRVMMLIPVVAVLGGALWIYGIGKSKPLVPTETVAVSNEQFSTVVKPDNSEWLAIDRDITSVSDEQEASAAQQPEVTATAPKEDIWFSMDVSGRRQVRETLVFRIENYKKDYTYTIDFGNGVVRDMEESISYRYPLAGHFDMKLTATSPKGETYEYIKKYEILPSSATATAQVSQ
ncbi:MAG: hypothetical protein NWR72_02220 [Bacteroidia bacterium]|nr:hypothetical protein [Bacteroidia bacterium]